MQGKSTSPRTNSRPASKQASPKDVRETSRSPTESTSNTIVSPRSPQEELHLFRGASPTLNTNVPPAPAIERVMATPQAKTREEVENEWKHTRRRSSSLERMAFSSPLIAPQLIDVTQEFLKVWMPTAMTLMKRLKTSPVSCLGPPHSTTRFRKSDKTPSKRSGIALLKHGGYA